MNGGVNNLRVELFGTLRAKAVREFRLGMKLNVGVDGAPVPFVISDFLAGCTDGNNPTESLDLAYCGL